MRRTTWHHTRGGTTAVVFVGGRADYTRKARRTTRMVTSTARQRAVRAYIGYPRCLEAPRPYYASRKVRPKNAPEKRVENHAQVLVGMKPSTRVFDCSGTRSHISSSRKEFPNRFYEKFKI